MPGYFAPNGAFVSSSLSPSQQSLVAGYGSGSSYDSGGSFSGYGGSTSGGIMGGGLEALFSPAAQLEPPTIVAGLMEDERQQYGFPTGSGAGGRTSTPAAAFSPQTPSGATQRAGLDRLMAGDRTGQPMWRY